MVQAIPKLLTLEEFLQLPETKPASEFIDGQIIQKSMPQGKHSAVQGDFVPAVNQVLRTQRIARAFIDPNEELIFAYRSDRTIAIFEQSQDKIPLPDFASSLEFTVGQIFSCLED